MEMADEAGFFACLVSGRDMADYRYEVHYDDERGIKSVKDAYRYHHGLTKQQIDKLNAGILYDSYEFMHQMPSVSV